MNSAEEKWHWWLVSYTYFLPLGGHGCGTHTQGTNQKVFNRDSMSYALKRGKNVTGHEVVITSLSYLGEMTKEEALGE